MLYSLARFNNHI